MAEQGIVEVKFAAKRTKIFDRVTPLAAGGVENEDQQLTTDDVPEKIVTQSDVLVRSLDQPWDIREGGTLESFEFHHPDNRIQGGEWIRRNLGMRSRNLDDQSRLPSIRVTHQADIRNLAQFQKKITFLTRPPFGELPRRAIDRTFEVGVPLAPSPALAQNELLIFLIEISHFLSSILGLALVMMAFGLSRRLGAAWIAVGLILYMIMRKTTKSPAEELPI